MSTNDGGPAFPLIAEGHEHVLSIGLSIRDYFAAKAMQAYLAHEAAPRRFSQEEIAATAYGMADAILAARSKT